jgi:hypothetical protein
LTGDEGAVGISAEIITSLITEYSEVPTPL